VQNRSFTLGLFLATLVSDQETLVVSKEAREVRIMAIDELKSLF